MIFKQNVYEISDQISVDLTPILKYKVLRLSAVDSVRKSNTIIAMQSGRQRGGYSEPNYRGGAFNDSCDFSNGIALVKYEIIIINDNTMAPRVETECVAPSSAAQTGERGPAAVRLPMFLGGPVCPLSGILRYVTSSGGVVGGGEQRRGSGAAGNSDGVAGRRRTATGQRGGGRAKGGGR